MIASFGSLLSITSAFFLLSIIWYAFSTQQPVSSFAGLSLELCDRIPASFHTYQELVLYF